MTNLADKINKIIDEDKINIDNIESIHESLKFIIDFRKEYIGKISNLYFTKYKLDGKFTDYLDNKIKIQDISYGWIFNESGSESSKYICSINFPNQKYILMISKFWNEDKAIVSFSKYNGKEDGDEKNDNFEFSIFNSNCILPDKIYELYSETGASEEKIISHLVIKIGIISELICSLKFEKSETINKINYNNDDDDVFEKQNNKNIVFL